MARTIDWYFDLNSPFAYLQLQALDRLPKDVAIVPKPVVLGAILKHWGQLGPAEIAPKRIHTYRLCQWLAAERGVPFRMPPRHPFNPIGGLRLMAALDADLATVRTAFAFIFAEGNAIDDEAGLGALAARLGVSGDVISLTQAPAVKDRLRAFTDEAIARNVFGVPTFHVDGENFWGDDATGMLAAYLADPALFKTGPMAAIDAVTVGAARR